MSAFHLNVDCCVRSHETLFCCINKQHSHTHGTKTPIVTLLLSLNTHSVVAFVGNHRNSASFLQTISTNKISIYNSSVSVSIVFLLRFLPIRCHIVGSSDFIHFRSFYQIPHRLLFAGCYIMLMHTHTHSSNNSDDICCNRRSTHVSCIKI